MFPANSLSLVQNTWILQKYAQMKKKTQSADQDADYAALHPLTRFWEVERDQMTIEKIIGKGALVRSLREQQ